MQPISTSPSMPAAAAPVLALVGRLSPLDAAKRLLEIAPHQAPDAARVSRAQAVWIARRELFTLPFDPDVPEGPARAGNKAHRHALHRVLVQGRRKWRRRDRRALGFVWVAKAIPRLPTANDARPSLPRWSR